MGSKAGLISYGCLALERSHAISQEVLHVAGKIYHGRYECTDVRGEIRVEEPRPWAPKLQIWSGAFSALGCHR